MNIISCKIGLISKPSNHIHDCFLNLGEIFDRSIREDVKILYELHKNLQYLCHFNVDINGKDITPDNIEELSNIQNRYKLTKKFWIKGQVENGVMKFFSPELYDLSCMVPLFPDKISRSIYTKSNQIPLHVFILFPYSDPIIRGKIIDNCFSINNNKSFFYVIGGLHGKNTIPTCDLSKRYLLECGVKDDDIICNEYHNFSDCILEALNMIKFIIPENIQMKVIVLVQREDMSRVMNHIIIANKLKIINSKLSIICDY